MSNGTCSQWFFSYTSWYNCLHIFLPFNSLFLFWIELRFKKAVVFMHAGFHLLDVSDSLKTARLGWWIEALRLFNGCLSGAAPFSWGEVSMATSGYHTTSQPSSVEDILCVSLFVSWSSEGGKHVCEWLVNGKLMETDRFMSH